jgi:hypothetical protein
MATEPDPVAALERIRSEFEAFGASGAGFSRLLGAVEEVLSVAAKAEHGALRWADPLPVPEWVAQIREAVSGKLPGEENPSWAAPSR